MTVSATEIASLVLSFQQLPGDSQNQQLDANWRAVTPEFFETLRIPSHAGRDMGENFTDEPREIVCVVEDTHGNTLSEAAAYFDSNQVLFRVSTD